MTDSLITPPDHSISLVELFCEECRGDEQETWFHAFLTLRDNSADPRVSIMQQLHFNDSGVGGRMVPELRPGAQQGYMRRLQKKKIIDAIQGPEAQILALWNHVLRFAVAVKNDVVFFDYMDGPSAVNCRTGALMALEMINQSIPESTIAQIIGQHYCNGTNTHTLRDKFSAFPAVRPQDVSASQSIQALRRENQSLAQALPGKDAETQHKIIPKFGG